MTDDIKPRRFICYCFDCRWAAEFKPLAAVPPRCPTCGTIALSYVSFHEHEKNRANEVLDSDIHKSVDDVAMYENQNAAK